MHAPVGRSSLVHKMACALFGTKPKPMLLLWQSDPREQTSVKFQSDFKHFHSRKCIWNVICNTAAFCYCLNLLTLWVLKPEYSRWCRPIPWMLMFWLLASPGLWTAMVLTLHNKQVLIFYKKPGLEGFGRYPVFTAVFTGKYRPGKNRFWTPKVGKTGKNTT